MNLKNDLWELLEKEIAKVVKNFNKEERDLVEMIRGVVYIQAFNKNMLYSTRN